MIPFAPGFFKPLIVSAPAGLTARLYDEFVGSDAASLSGRTPDVGGNWSATDLLFDDAEILSNRAILVHDGSGNIENTAGHMSALASSWSRTATLKVKLSLDFVVNEVVNSVFGFTEIALGTAASAVSDFPSANGFQLRVYNYTNNSNLAVSWEVRSGGTLRQSGGTTFTPSIGSAQNVTLEYDAATTDVDFSLNGSLVETKALTYTDLPATISHGVLRIGTLRYDDGGGAATHRVFDVETCLIAFDSP